MSFTYDHAKGAAVDMLTLDAEIKATVGLETCSGITFNETTQVVTSVFPAEIDADQIADFQAAVDAHVATNLDAQRRDKLAAIDYQTMVLIAPGFTHDAKQFSLSINAQLKWTELVAGIAAGLIVDPTDYPIDVSALDESKYVLADEVEAKAIAKACGDRVKYILTEGTDLKDDAKNAVDQAALDAVVDNRV